MEHKTFTPELKLIDDDAGILEGYASTFLNWDSVRERPVKGAFAPHLDAFLKDGFIAIGHNWQSLPVATPVEAYEDDHGLFVRAAFHSTPEGQAARTVVKERLARGKSVKSSIGYEVLEDEYVADGRLLKNVKLYEWSIVNVPANQAASMTYAKSLPLADHAATALAAVADFKDRITDLSQLRAKEGRVLSNANRERISQVKTALAALIQDLDALLSATEPVADTSKAAQDLYIEFLRLESSLLGVKA